MKNLLFLTAVLSLFTSVYSGSAANAAEDSMELGKLYYVNLKEGEQPIMTGLSLFGNRCGSADFNKKPYAAEGIRSVFELDEWLNDETPDYIQEIDLNKDPDAGETNHWGSFYLHPEEVEPGYYDFVFIYGNKVFATMLTRFFKPDELYQKPDSELEKLMKECIKR